jgi:hypothetical protein
LVPSSNGDEFIGFRTEHNWTHICGLWELPYFKALILRHHINVMHQERNVAESIVMMCINFTDKTKYNIKMRKDSGATCDRPSLELNDRGRKPHAPFCLKPKQREK